MIEREKKLKNANQKSVWLLDKKVIEIVLKLVVVFNINIQKVVTTNNRDQQQKRR